MGTRELPPLELLQKWFSYDPATGILARKAYHPKGRGIRGQGQSVGTLTEEGYLICRANYQICFVHRIAWKMCFMGQSLPRLLIT